ncbi:hypothetical protein [Arthrobacter sp. ISL-72]|uniref:hypothetical protein n=1 Tax=Arthrobacter sp. ISL-72 TaxID=2819114 RepID=UPI001BE862B7|nr:hypothetical protein [Arthrobacter sp. ISL-72]MBT2594758.1 hypothetical protein [Arthrobacter sp. ISL-72]
MDAQSTPETPAVDPPRHLFFGAEDRRQGGKAGLVDKYLSMEKARRHQLAEHVIVTANQLASAVRTLRAFDRTGNADMAVDHIEQTFEDLRKYTTNLVNEVNASVDRYGDELEQLAFRDIRAAREASDAQTPKPGPGPIAVVNVANAEDVAQVKANLELALNRVGAQR